jgi:hypothetical protein
VAESTDWDALCALYVADLPPLRSPLPIFPTKEFAAPYADFLSRPTNEDTDWLTRALVHRQNKWFVAGLLDVAPSIAGTLFAPILNAAIDEVNPSLNRVFVEPCIRVFGSRRVIEYFLNMLERGTDCRKAGAANALYWCSGPLLVQGHISSFDAEQPTAESRSEPDGLADLWRRERTLLLRTFVSNPNVDVRRSVIGKLDLRKADYDPTDRPLVPKAIAIARAHPDPYIRHRVAVQLGECRIFRALPHRKEKLP